MKIDKIEIGFKFQHGVKGECIVVDRTKRTITVQHKFGTIKTTYKHADAYFSPSDF